MALYSMHSVRPFKMKKRDELFFGILFYKALVLTFLFFLIVLSGVHHTNAFPTGAGGCSGDMAAVGDSHLDDANGRPVSNNTLQAGGIEVRIGNATLQSDINISLDLATNMDHTITIVSTQFPVRGILIRLQAPNGVETTNVLTPGFQMKVADVCLSPIVGTTHFDNTEKFELTSVVRFDEVIDSVFLDITGVFINNAEGSVYVYSRYIVSFISDSTSPQPTPNPSILEPPSVPTISPVTEMPLVPTTAPIMVETMQPSASPVSVKPTKEPQDSFQPSTMDLKTPSLLPETESPSCIETSLEPSLRGGAAGGMMNGMGKGNICDEDRLMTGKGMMRGDGKGKMSGEGKGSKHDMKKPKDEEKKQMEMR